MEQKIINKRYNEYIEARIPKTKPWPTLLNAFWVGGTICIVGQLINNFLLFYFPSVSVDTAWAITLMALIFLASFLTALGVWDKIGAFAGAGAIIPITGFSNSITSPTMEYNHEGIIFGICVKMFTIAGPVIVCGTVASVIVGLIYIFI